jgi:hypothetical protein
MVFIVSKGKWRLDVESEYEKFSLAFIIIFKFIVTFLIILLFLLCYVVNCVTWTSVLPQSCFEVLQSDYGQMKGQCNYNFCFLVMQKPYSGLDRNTVEVSVSHTDTLRLRGILWTRNRSVAEVSTWQQTTFTRGRHPWPVRDSNPQLASERPQTYALDRATTGIGVALSNI